MTKFNTGKVSVLALSAAFAVAFSLFFNSSTPVSADHDPFGGVPQTSVTLCHAEGNGSFNSITPNISGSGGNLNLQGHENNNGVHVNDIIPPFHWSDGSATYSYPGKNWVAGQTTWNNDCVVPASPTPTPTATPTGTPTATPTATPTIDPCIVAENCNESTPTPDATATPTPTTNGNDGGDGLGCATHDCSGSVASASSQGQILGASTMAKAGSFAETLNLAIMALGGIFTFQGFKNFKKVSKKA